MAKKRRAKKYKLKMSAGSKKTVIAVLIWALAALFAVICALAIGNALGDRADSIEKEEAAPPIYEYEGEAAPSLDAVFVNIKGRGNDALAKLAKNLPQGADISIVLRDEDSAPNYRSAVAEAVNSNGGGACDLGGFISELKAGERYVSGCFYSSLASADSTVARWALIDYEAALIAEAFFSGVDDVVVLGLPTDSEGAAYASALFRRVREKCENAVLGAAVDYFDFRSGTAAAALEYYGKFADFCVLDTRNAGKSAAEVANEMLYYFEEYPLRVLIGENSTAGREAQKAALSKLGIYNIQSAQSQEIAG